MFTAAGRLVFKQEDSPATAHDIPGQLYCSFTAAGEYSNSRTARRAQRAQTARTAQTEKTAQTAQTAWTAQTARHWEVGIYSSRIKLRRKFDLKYEF